MNYKYDILCRQLLAHSKTILLHCLYLAYVAEVSLQMYMWQSWVEIKYYSVAYFERVTVFEAL